MRKLAVLASTVAMLTLTTPADAALLQFTISGFDTLSGIVPAPVEFASFQIDSNPLIATGNFTAGLGFAVGNVAGTFRYGSTTVTTPQTINFYNAAIDGGLFVGDGSLLAFDGPQLYTGSEATPQFRLGQFTLTDFYTGSPISLTIAAVAAVPEPASWAMMLIGFAMVGGAARYRRRNTTVAYA